MPKASVHENNALSSGQNNVWSPGKITLLQSVAVPEAMEVPADNQLRISVACPYARHKRASFFGCSLLRHAPLTRVTEVSTQRCVRLPPLVVGARHYRFGGRSPSWIQQIQSHRETLEGVLLHGE